MMELRADCPALPSWIRLVDQRSGSVNELKGLGTGRESRGRWEFSLSKLENHNALGKIGTGNNSNETYKRYHSSLSPQTRLWLWISSH